MSKFYFLSAFFCISYSLICTSQTIWAGGKITFTKADAADWTLAENQDRITDSVWITRANNKSIFNIRSEEVYTNNFSPQGTEWAKGNMSGLDNLVFADYETAMGAASPILNEDFVLHLLAEDIYIDIRFKSWSGGMAGGFSYERSMEGAVATVDKDSFHFIMVFPNPASNYLRFSTPLTGAIKISAISGRAIADYDCNQTSEIDISQLEGGHYLLSFFDGTGHPQTLSFSKL